MHIRSDRQPMMQGLAMGQLPLIVGGLETHLATVALGFDNGGVQAGQQSALGRDVDEAV